MPGPFVQKSDPFDTYLLSVGHMKCFARPQGWTEEKHGCGLPELEEETGMCKNNCEGLQKHWRGVVRVGFLKGVWSEPHFRIRTFQAEVLVSTMSGGQQ